MGRARGFDQCLFESLVNDDIRPWRFLGAEWFDSIFERGL
jgi:hypothetical protein